MRSDRLVVSVVGLLMTMVPHAESQGTHGSYRGFTPGACAWIPRMVEHFIRRAQIDTSAYDPRADSTMRVATDSVRSCSAAYGTSFGPWELLNHARVQLILGEDAEAGSTMRSYLAALPDSSAGRQAWARYLMVGDYLRAKPARSVAAHETTVQLDKLGSRATRASVLSHLMLARDARARWDDSTARSEASNVIARWRMLAPDAALAMAQSATDAFMMKAELELRVKGGDAARAVIDTAQRMMPALAAAARRQITTAARLYSVVGKKAAPVEGTYWFNAGGGASARPFPGKVFIISEASHSCGPSCRPRYQSLARLERRFGSRGLELINTTRTLGFVRDTAPVLPIDEAKYDSTHFLVDRGVPGSLAVYETKYRWLPDGRRANDPNPQDINYPFATFTIVDRSGVVRYVSFGWDPMLEEPLARLIERLLDGA